MSLSIAFFRMTFHIHWFVCLNLSCESLLRIPTVSQPGLVASCPLLWFQEERRWPWFIRVTSSHSGDSVSLAGCLACGPNPCPSPSFDFFTQKILLCWRLPLWTVSKHKKESCFIQIQDVQVLPKMWQTESSMPGYAWLLSTGCIGVPGSCKWSLSYNSSILGSSAVLLSSPSKQTSHFSSVCGFGGGTSSEIPVKFLSGEIFLDFDSYCRWKILLPARHERPRLWENMICYFSALSHPDFGGHYAYTHNSWTLVLYGQLWLSSLDQLFPSETEMSQKEEEMLHLF